MTAAAWEPGMPLMPDNGCGPMVAVSLSPDERAAVIAEGGTPPPWHRPEGVYVAPTTTRTCADCGVRWSGDAGCWMCGASERVNPRQTRHTPAESAATGPVDRNPTDEVLGRQIEGERP